MVHPWVTTWVQRCGLLLVLWAGHMQAAEIPPPSLVLQHPRTQVLVGAYVERVADGRYRFVRVEDVRGPDTTSNDLLIRAPDWLQPQLSAGMRYLLAYSSYIANPRFPKDFIVDSQGPLLVMTTGLEPALFRDDANLRSALMHPLDDETLQSDRYRAQLLAGLDSDDPQLQNFYAAELTQVDALNARNDAALIAAVKRHTSARTGLLRMVARRQDIYGRRYLATAVQEILRQAPLSGYQQAQSGTGDLVRAALEIADRDSIVLPIQNLARLAGSDSAALAEAALLAIRRSDAQQETRIARAALNRSLLPATTRTFLSDHLRRLDLANAATSTPSTDSNLGEKH
jgi:hypothetical protein